MAKVSAEWAAFLNTIRLNPEDDVPRLIFADYLQERGEETRAELIRIQCCLAQGVPDRTLEARLWHRQFDLIQTHADTWLGRLRERISGWRFERGLLEIALPANEFSAAGRYFESAIVQSVRLTPTSMVADIVSVLRSAYLQQCHTLDLSGLNLTDEQLAPLCAAANSPRGNGWPTYCLDLRNNQLGRNEVIPFAAFARVRHLRLDGNPLQSDSRLLLQCSKWGHHYSPTPPGEQPTQLLNSIQMRLQRIPAGTFSMGSPMRESHHEVDETQHEVTLTRDFYLGNMLVTQQQYLAVLGRNPSHFSQTEGGTLAHPVENVTWNDAVQFCELLSQLPAEQKANRVYRLATEAEWEYACRAGTPTPYAFGKRLLSMHANFESFVGRTTPVGHYWPNSWGLYDMHGNLREWCNDYYDRSYYERSPAVVDPTGSTEASSRVLRGGSWDVAAMHYCRSAYRVYYSASGQLNGIGFRVAMTIT